MKLVHPDQNMQLLLNEGEIVELIIENPKAFYSYSMQLYGQTNGYEGGFVLSDHSSIIKFDSYVDCITTPFLIDINQRKVLNKLYNEIKQEVMTTDLIDDFYAINTCVSELLRKVNERLDYTIIYDDILDPSVILKQANVKIHFDENQTLLEKLSDYIKIMTRFLGIRVLILINMKACLESQDFIYINAILKYEKVSLLLIENNEGYKIESASRYIIDKDLCEIYNK